MSSGRPQWRGSDNLLRSPGSGARHSPAHRLDAVGAEGRSRRVRRRRGAREGLSPLSARGVGQAPAAAQPSRKSQPSSPDANPVQEVAGTVVRHGWVPLGPTERPPGARQTCFWALFQRSRANHSWHEPRATQETQLQLSAHRLQLSVASPRTIAVSPEVLKTSQRRLRYVVKPHALVSVQ